MRSGPFSAFFGCFGSVLSEFGAEIRGFGSLFALVGSGRRLLGARGYF